MTFINEMTHTIEINYSGSGIKTLRGASYALMIVCIIAALEQKAHYKAHKLGCCF